MAIQFENMVRLQQGLGGRASEFLTATSYGSTKVEVDFTTYKEFLDVNPKTGTLLSVQSAPTQQPTQVVPVQ